MFCDWWSDQFASMVYCVEKVHQIFPFLLIFIIALHLGSSVLWILHIHPRMVSLWPPASSWGSRAHRPQITAQLKCLTSTERTTLSLKMANTFAMAPSQWLGISMCLFLEECESWKTSLDLLHHRLSYCTGCTAIIVPGLPYSFRGTLVVKYLSCYWWVCTCNLVVWNFDYGWLFRRWFSIFRFLVIYHW